MTTRKQLDQEYHQRIVAENDELGAEVKRLTDENVKLQPEIDNFLGRNDRGPESIRAGKFATQDNEKDE